MLLTLFVLVIAAAATVSMARRSLDRAAEASAMTDRLHRRWGAISIKRAVLPQAEAILSRADVQANEPSSSVTVRLSLSGRQFTLVLADEQAKLNVNTMASRSNQPTTDRTIRRMLWAARADVTVRLRPTPELVLRKSLGVDRPYASWDQMLVGAGPMELISADRLLENANGITLGVFSPIDVVTCWGDGRVNLARAHPAVLAEALSPPLDAGEISQLVSLRTFHPGASADCLLDQIGVREARRREVLERITDRSTCHSLWIVCRDGDRLHAELHVDEPLPVKKSLGSLGSGDNGPLRRSLHHFYW